MPGPSKELVFVDDSDDDTPKVLQRILRDADCPGLVMQRTRSHRDGGLSTAVVRGFMVSGGAYICTMDADLQHPASAVPLLLDAAVKKRADIVVGSRYLTRHDRVSGFETAGRRLVSSTATSLALRLVPEARATTDPLSGFFMLRRSVIDGIDLRPRGYKILLEILVRGRWRKVIDVPYSFHSRNAGVSKATMREGVQFFQHLVTLKQRRSSSVEPRPTTGTKVSGVPRWLSVAQNGTMRPQEQPNGKVEAGTTTNGSLR